MRPCLPRERALGLPPRISIKPLTEPLLWHYVMMNRVRLIHVSTPRLCCSPLGWNMPTNICYGRGVRFGKSCPACHALEELRNSVSLVRSPGFDTMAPMNYQAAASLPGRSERKERKKNMWMFLQERPWLVDTCFYAVEKHRGESECPWTEIPT